MRWSWIEISPPPIPLSDWSKIFIGRAEETEAHVGEALRLSPRDPTRLHLDVCCGLQRSCHLGTLRGSGRLVSAGDDRSSRQRGASAQIEALTAVFKPVGVEVGGSVECAAGLEMSGLNDRPTLGREVAPLRNAIAPPLGPTCTRDLQPLAARLSERAEPHRLKSLNPAVQRE